MSEPLTAEQCTTETRLYNDLYDADISVLVGGNVNAVRALIESRHGVHAQLWSGDKPFVLDFDDTDGLAFYIRNPLGHGERFYAWVAHPAPALLYHEIFHTTFDVLQHRGIQYSEATDEAFAYLGGWIFSNYVHQGPPMDALLPPKVS